MMTNLSKINMHNLRRAQNPDEGGSNKLERGDLGQTSQGYALHNQIGRRLRNIFPAPDEPADAFDSLLKEISSRLP